VPRGYQERPAARTASSAPATAGQPRCSVPAGPRDSLGPRGKSAAFRQERAPRASGRRQPLWTSSSARRPLRWLFASSPIASATGVNDGDTPSVPEGPHVGARPTPSFRPARVFVPNSPGNRKRGTRARALPRWWSRRWKWCSDRLVGRAPRLQTYCKRIGLPPQTSRKHLTAETQRNHPRRSGKPSASFALVRPPSQTTRYIGAPGFEPGTSPTRTARATRLRHAPTHVQYPTTALRCRPPHGARPDP
jgi:hypothetical protein